ncbi:hypothetical protein GGR50DRAFT_673908 [Xylaria sp. CBS 124048]|nr:hypothetical protein GGR50DRAFT_673908 [Xylaria sp. CBS 124048]
MEQRQSPEQSTSLNPVDNEPGGAASFSRFGSMSTELRMMVWEIALIDPRVVVLFNRERCQMRRCDKDFLAGRRPAILRQHVLFRVNRESRGMAKRLLADGSSTTLYSFELLRFNSHPNPRPLSLFTHFSGKHDWLCVDPDFQLPMLEYMRDRLGYTKVNGFEDEARNVAFISRPGTILPNMKWIMTCVMDHEFFKRTKNLGFIYRIITLHVTPQRAWDAGLLHYGDSHILVNLKDTNRLQKFYSFYRRAAPHRTSREILLFFRHLGFPSKDKGHPEAMVEQHSMGRQTWLMKETHMMKF